MLDFDWLFYIAKVHLNYSKEEFYKSCPKEIGSLWETHVKLNGWKFKEDNDTSNNSDDDTVYCVDELSWL